MQNVAPWPDYDGNAIRAGDTIVHPNGTTGVVVLLPDMSDEHDRWRVNYDGKPFSRLSLQIGDKGQAVVKS